MFNSLLLFVLFSLCIYSHVTCSSNSFSSNINDSLPTGAANLLKKIQPDASSVLLGGLVSSSLGEEGIPVIGCAIGFTLGRLYHNFSTSKVALSIGVALLNHQKHNLFNMLLSGLIKNNGGVNAFPNEVGAVMNPSVGSASVGQSGSKPASVHKPLSEKVRENALRRGATVLSHGNKEGFEAVWKSICSRHGKFEDVWNLVCQRSGLLKAVQPTRIQSRL